MKPLKIGVGSIEQFIARSGGGILSPEADGEKHDKSRYDADYSSRLKGHDEKIKIILKDNVKSDGIISKND